VNNSEATLAAHPIAITRTYADIVKDSGFVKENAARMNGASERHLFGMEEIEA
jgi:hypothetical protein